MLSLVAVPRQGTQWASLLPFFMSYSILGLALVASVGSVHEGVTLENTWQEASLGSRFPY